MMKRISRIVVHWSASGSDIDVATIRKWHRAKGWKDVGYHRIIEHPDHPRTKGQKLKWSYLIKQGRPLDFDLFMTDEELGAHTLGFNSGSIGWCVISGPDCPIHPLQEEALRKGIAVHLDRFKLKPSQVYGHRELMATQCPGDEIMGIVKSIRGV